MRRRQRRVGRGAGGRADRKRRSFACARRRSSAVRLPSRRWRGAGRDDAFRTVATLISLSGVASSRRARQAAPRSPHRRKNGPPWARARRKQAVEARLMPRRGRGPAGDARAALRIETLSARPGRARLGASEAGRWHGLPRSNASGMFHDNQSSRSRSSGLLAQY